VYRAVLEGQSIFRFEAEELWTASREREKRKEEEEEEERGERGTYTTDQVGRFGGDVRWDCVVETGDFLVSSYGGERGGRGRRGRQEEGEEKSVSKSCCFGERGGTERKGKERKERKRKNNAP
jgi:hypothetical protein